MKTVISVLNSGAGPNLIHLRCLAENLRLAIRSVNSPPLIGVSTRPVRLLDLLVLLVRTGQFRARVDFLVVASMAVYCILGTIFIDRHVRENVPPHRKIFFHHATAVALLGAKEPSTETASYANRTKTGAANDPPTPRKVRLVKTVTVLPMTQVTIRVSAPAAGLCFLQSHPHLAMRHFTLMAQGVLDVIPHQPFTVGVSNVGDKPVHLPKHTTLGISLPSPAHIMTIGSASPGMAGGKERGENGGEGSSSTVSEKTWEDEVSVSLEDETVRRDVLQFLEECQDMWSGRLGKNGVAKHKIELTPEAKPIYRLCFRKRTLTFT